MLVRTCQAGEAGARDRTTHTWDYENQPAGIACEDDTLVTFTYGHVTRRDDRLRVATDDDGTVTRLVYDGRNVAREVDELGTVETEYTYQPQAYGNLLSAREDTESTFYLFDAHGNTSKVVDSTAVVTEEYVHDAFGRELSATGATAANTFQGEWGYRYDRTQSEYDARARIYEPRDGRLLSPDPATGEELEFYKYVDNDPVNNTDPSGQITLGQPLPTAWGGRTISRRNIWTGSGVGGQYYGWAALGIAHSAVQGGRDIFLLGEEGRTKKTARTFFTQLGVTRWTIPDILRNQIYRVVPLEGANAVIPVLGMDIYREFKADDSAFATVGLKAADIDYRINRWWAARFDPALAARVPRLGEVSTLSVIADAVFGIGGAVAQQIAEFACRQLASAAGTDVCKGIKELVANCSELLASARDLFAAIVEAVLEGGWDFVKNLMSGVKSGIALFTSGIWESIASGLAKWLKLEDVDLTSLFEALKDWFASAATPETWAKAIRSVLEWIGLAVENLRTLAAEIVDPRLVEPLVTVVSTYLDEGWDGVREWFGEEFGGAVEQVELIGNTLGSFFTDLRSDFTGTLGDLMKEQLLPKLTEVVASMAARIVPGVGPLGLAVDVFQAVTSNCCEIRDLVVSLTQVIRDVGAGRRATLDDLGEKLKRILDKSVVPAIKFAAAILKVTEIPDWIATAVARLKDFVASTFRRLVRPLADLLARVLSRLFGKPILTETHGIEGPDDYYAEIDADGNLYVGWNPSFAWKDFRRELDPECRKRADELYGEQWPAIDKVVSEIETIRAKHAKDEDAAEAEERPLRETKLIPLVREFLDGLDGCGVNACNLWGFKKTATPAGGGSWTTYIGKKFKTDATGETLESFKGKDDSGRKTHGHHIVMKGDAFPENAEARQILCRHGIDPFTDRENLSFSPNWCHSKAYAIDVVETLERAEPDGREGIVKALKKLAGTHRRCPYDRSGVVDENTDELPPRG